MKHWKHETLEDYYNRFLQLCVIIPQQPNDIYLRETFREGLRNKLKLTSIGMPMQQLLKLLIRQEKLKKRCLHHARVNDFNHCRTMMIQMRNQLKMYKRRKEPKITKSKMTNINKVYSVKNVIMKVVWQRNANLCRKFATSVEDKGMKPMTIRWRS